MDYPRFRSFARTYLSTISRKLEDAKDFQDVGDVFAELGTAARLLFNPSFDVEYEPFGKVGVDFHVHYDRGESNAETKRVRETQATTTFEQCRARIVSAVREIPAQLGISIDCYAMHADPTSARHLHDVIDEVVHQACTAVKELNGKLKDGLTETITLDGFPEFQLRITHVPEKDPNSPTANFGGVSPLLYSQKESRKYADRIFDAIKQFREGVPNVLVLWSDSITHEPDELTFAIQEIEQSMRDGEQAIFTKRSYKDAADFGKQFRLMTAAVAVSQQPRVPGMSSANAVWLHSDPETPFGCSPSPWLHEL
jgi:hypothetical protein